MGFSKGKQQISLFILSKRKKKINGINSYRPLNCLLNGSNECGTPDTGRQTPPPKGRFSPKYAVGGPDNHEPTRRNGHVVDVKTVGYITYCKNI